eukprot:6776430-Alexandrium_andersonii.AAC.1
MCQVAHQLSPQAVGRHVIKTPNKKDKHAEVEPDSEVKKAMARARKLEIARYPTASSTNDSCDLKGSPTPTSGATK